MVGGDPYGLDWGRVSCIYSHEYTLERTLASYPVSFHEGPGYEATSIQTLLSSFKLVLKQHIMFIEEDCCD